MVKDSYQKIKILYIASASRSGSTILEHALGALADVVNVGEIRRLNDFYNENFEKIRDPKNQRGCTCGKRVRDCAYWQSVEEASGLDFTVVKLSSQMSFLNRALFKVLFFLAGSRFPRHLAKIYRPFREEMKVADNIFRIYEAACKIKGSRYVIDSSKMTHQYMILKAFQPDRINLIALVRDGRAVSRSMIRGQRKKYFNPGKSIVDTAVGDIYSRLFRSAVIAWFRSVVGMLFAYYRTPATERLFMKYEEFCQQPGAETKRLVEKFGLADKKAEMPVIVSSHSIGGSPSRFKADFTKISLDEKWKDSWSRRHSRIFMMYGGVLNRILGYKYQKWKVDK